MSCNAIILAAGKSTRFAPFTYERPKGLFRVKGEYLIERQINQLIEAGVKEIYIVVGLMGVQLDGEMFDMGIPQAYRNCITKF